MFWTGSVSDYSYFGAIEFGGGVVMTIVLILIILVVLGGAITLIVIGMRDT